MTYPYRKSYGYRVVVRWCNARGCDKIYEGPGTWPTHLFCVEHWKLIPKELQLEIRRAISKSDREGFTHVFKMACGFADEVFYFEEEAPAP